MRYDLLQGDLLDQEGWAEALVNPWNRNLLPVWLLWPQGVTGALLARAGREPFRELARLGLLPLGGAVATGPGRLRCRGLIHVAGISLAWRATPASVAASVGAALAVAEARGWSRLAFPLIGAGSWGMDEGGSLAAMEGALKASSAPVEVRVVRWTPRP